MVEVGGCDLIENDMDVRLESHPGLFPGGLGLFPGNPVGNKSGPVLFPEGNELGSPSRGLRICPDEQLRRVFNQKKSLNPDLGFSAFRHPGFTRCVPKITPKG
eukprot:scaffold1483_cov374-Pavlova_lutheri.AAC.21